MEKQTVILNKMAKKYRRRLDVALKDRTAAVKANDNMRAIGAQLRIDLYDEVLFDLTLL